MGRPLFSTLYASEEPVVHVADPTPSYETWSPKNAFDPDADEFFASEDVVYEAFLTPEEIAARESEPDSTPQPDIPPSLNTEYLELRRRLRERVQQQADAQLRTAEEDVPPGLLQEIDSSSSEGTSSGQESPAEAISSFLPSRLRTTSMTDSMRRAYVAERFELLQRRVSELENEERQAERGPIFDPVLVERMYNEFTSMPISHLVIPGLTSAQDTAMSPSTPTTPDRALPVAMTPPQSSTPRSPNRSQSLANTPVPTSLQQTYRRYGRLYVGSPPVAASPQTPLVMSVHQ